MGGHLCTDDLEPSYQHSSCGWGGPQGLASLPSRDEGLACNHPSPLRPKARDPALRVSGIPSQQGTVQGD